MTTPLDRLHSLKRATAELGRLPWSVRVEGARVTRDGEDLVVLHEDHTERFREGEISTGGLAGFFGSREPVVWWHDGQETRMIRADGSAETAEFPGGLPDDRELRQRTREARDGDPVLETALAVGRIRTRGEADDARKAQEDLAPHLLAGQPAQALLAGLDALSSREAVKDLARLLLPSAPQPNARALEDLLDLPFGGKDGNLRATLLAGLQHVDSPPLEFTRALLESTHHGPSQHAFVRATLDRAGSPLPANLRMAGRLSEGAFEGKGDAYGETARALLASACDPRASGWKSWLPLLTASLATAHQVEANQEVLRAWLGTLKEEGVELPASSGAFLRAMTTWKMPGKFENLRESLSRLLPTLEAPALAQARAVMETSSSPETSRAVVQAMARAAGDPATQRLGNFLADVGALRYSGKFDSATAALKAGLAAPRPEDGAGEALLRAGLAALEATHDEPTRREIARLAVAAAGPKTDPADPGAIFRPLVPDEELQADPRGALSRALASWSEAAPPAEEAGRAIVQGEGTVSIGGITLPRRS